MRSVEGIRKKGYCLSCGARLSDKPRLSFFDMPASAQHIPDAEELSEDKGIELSLYECPDCGLSQFDCEPVSYYREVIRAVGLSKTMRELRRRDYRYLTEDLGLSGGRFIECGCGRGEFLEVLKEFPVEIYGIEADKAQARAADRLLNDGKAEGISAVKVRPGGPKADQIEKKETKVSPTTHRNLGECHISCTFTDRADMELFGAPFDCFLSFNFLEHQPDPVSMLLCMYNNLKPGGYGLITVPSFEYILEQGYYYELIRDHIANYELSSLKLLLCRCGFEVLDAKRIGIGDTLRLLVRKPEKTGQRLLEALPLDRVKEGLKEGTKDAPPHMTKENVCTGRAENEEISDKNTVKYYDKYEKIRNNQKNIEYKIKKLCQKLEAERKSLVLWGAGHQGFTIASTTALKDYASAFADSADFKQGRFAPASHLPIISPEELLEHPADVVLITAPGYVKEIRGTIEQLFSERSKEAPEVMDILSLLSD